KAGSGTMWRPPRSTRPEKRLIKTASPLTSVSRSGNWMSIMTVPPRSVYQKRLARPNPSALFSFGSGSFLRLARRAVRGRRRAEPVGLGDLPAGDAGAGADGA